MGPNEQWEQDCNECYDKTPRIVIPRRPDRETAISADDILNLKITLETATIDEFIASC